MGTRSSIGIEKADGKIKAVYCHYDGYPSHVGKMLLKYYNSTDKANELVKLGDLSELGKSIEKPEGHTFEKPVKGYSIFYRRDRGEKSGMPKLYPRTKDVFNSLDVDWLYVYKPKEKAWYYIKHNEKELRLLSDDSVRLDYEIGGAIKGDKGFNYEIGGL